MSDLPAGTPISSSPIPADNGAATARQGNADSAATAPAPPPAQAPNPSNELAADSNRFASEKAARRADPTRPHHLPADAGGMDTSPPQS